MILVTVGMQLGFDRLIRIMDGAAAMLGEPVVAQTGIGTYRAHHMDSRTIIDPVELEALARNCRVIVAHAGIGSVLMARKCRKPIILFPRWASLGEHRTDHQMATAKALAGRSGIYVAETESELIALLNKPLDVPDAGEDIAGRERLMDTISTFIDDAAARRKR